MRLSRWTSISLISIALAACSDSIDPSAVPGLFKLNDINGRPLPTYQAPTTGSTLTVKSATLNLDFFDKAEFSQQIIQSDGTEATATVSYNYRVSGNELIFELSPPCPINANCLAPPVGRISGTDLVDLEIGRVDNVPIVYHFQRVRLAAN